MQKWNDFPMRLEMFMLPLSVLHVPHCTTPTVDSIPGYWRMPNRGCDGRNELFNGNWGFGVRGFNKE